MARLTIYSQDLADKICAELANGYSLRTVCKAEDMPCKATIFNWLRTHKEFLDQYARAKTESVDTLVDDMIDIADDATNDWMEVHGEDGSVIGYKLNGEHIQRSKLRIDTRKWLAIKLQPKKYGDKQQIEQSGEVKVIGLSGRF